MVTISYETQAITASSGVDYLPASATLQLEDGQEEAIINVTLVDDSEREFAEQFSVTLVNPTGLCPFGLAVFVCFGIGSQSAQGFTVLRFIDRVLVLFKMDPCMCFEVLDFAQT